MEPRASVPPSTASLLSTGSVLPLPLPALLIQPFPYLHSVTIVMSPCKAAKHAAQMYRMRTAAHLFSEGLAELLCLLLQSLLPLSACRQQ